MCRRPRCSRLVSERQKTLPTQTALHIGFLREKNVRNCGRACGYLETLSHLQSSSLLGIVNSFTPNQGFRMYNDVEHDRTKGIVIEIATIQTRMVAMRNGIGGSTRWASVIKTVANVRTLCAIISDLCMSRSGYGSSTKVGLTANQHSVCWIRSAGLIRRL
jgi:hypothetical protein